MTDRVVTQNDAALAGLVNLLVVLADNKYAMGRRLTDWAVGAPVLETSVACASIAQQHMGAARVLYPLLDDLPSPVPSGPPTETGREHPYHVTFLDEEWPTWPHAVCGLVVVDSALNVLLRALEGSSYGTLAGRVGRMLEDERFVREFAEGRVRELLRFPDGRRLLQELVDGAFVEMLCWFGPPGEEGVEQLKAEGMLDGDSEAMRQRYLDRVAPVLLDAGIALPVERGDGGWRYAELPWERWDRLHRRLGP